MINKNVIAGAVLGSLIVALLMAIVVYWLIL
jgi:hypothetical protein